MSTLYLSMAQLFYYVLPISTKITLLQNFKCIFMSTLYLSMTQLFYYVRPISTKFHMCKIFNVFHIYPISTILVYLSKTQLFYYVRLISTKILHVQNSQCIFCLPCLNNSSIFIYDLAILLCPTYINKKFTYANFLTYFYVYPISTILVYQSMTQLFYYVLPISAKNSHVQIF